MAFNSVSCGKCGTPVKVYLNPIPTVDVIIEKYTGKHCDGIILIERRNEPPGWALPGGFVDYGESAETAAHREAREETGIDLDTLTLFGVYSEPGRDPRHHTISVIYTSRTADEPVAGDDARNARVFPLDNLPGSLAFDHGLILADYIAARV